MSSPRTVLVSDADRVRTLSMHRPERLNAFDGSLVQGLAEALTAAAGASEISVVVLRGSGRAFSTGADLKALAEPRPPAGGEGGSGFDDLLHLLADFPKPLIMAVHGYAVGFGMTILAFADLVLMSTDTRMRCPFTELGAPTEAASSYLLPKLLGRQDAAWLLLSSEWITAAEAKEIGLAWRLCEPDELFDVAADHAGRLAARPVEGLKLVKNLLNAPDRAELAAAISRESAALKKFVASFPSRG